MTNHAIQMYDYHVWAMKTIINRLKELPQAVYTQDIQSVFSSLAKALSHIYVVDCGWLAMLSGHSMSEAMSHAQPMQQEMEALSLTELESKFLNLFEDFKSFLHRQENLEALITLDNPYAGVRETSLAEMVLQVVNHGTYHRGNITAMLRQIGIPSVMTEYALYWYSE
ncbi:DinB family protein [Paenibacillus sp. GCM10027628]|uniref:DinB family protein n=1 Tax=Paenibacillus sp. GCM10027628 TaxID=3273413 RepID=UPI003643FF10